MHRLVTAHCMLPLQLAVKRSAGRLIATITACIMFMWSSGICSGFHSLKSKHMMCSGCDAFPCRTTNLALFVPFACAKMRHLNPITTYGLQYLCQMSFCESGVRVYTLLVPCRRAIFARI